MARRKREEADAQTEAQRGFDLFKEALTAIAAVPKSAVRRTQAKAAYGAKRSEKRNQK